MIHAKTAVFDGKFSRVGSTNLNIASWFGNYELDVLVEDENFGKQMQEMFLEDLENSTEIVLAEMQKSKSGRKRGKNQKDERRKRQSGNRRSDQCGGFDRFGDHKKNAARCGGIAFFFWSAALLLGSRCFCLFSANRFDSADFNFAAAGFSDARQSDEKLP